MSCPVTYFVYLMFSEICITIFSKVLLKHVVVCDFIQSVFNRSISNYYVVTFVLQEESLKSGPILSLKRSFLNLNTYDGRSL
jgi:hypothetical protein